ncbi:hypothetical protein BC628DRAFT_1413959 [Trametes gibbosa]|nr:hypothetical protein BC628DRAFT_1413959 [Trametes gibbosa]
MSRYHQPTQPYTSSAIAGPAPQAQDPARPDLVRHERDDSLSDSETSTSFNPYADSVREDAPAHDSDDPYLALTSQTLNADGTPKRPMNAFMIFARKRRPQISAANQMMRTGDVSKILSKEWNSMEMDEKKFYLDQAKKLKDNFNSKYPDYVYRRRPNNSRKKRKPDTAPDDAHDPAAHLGDPDDPAYDDTSPVDPEDTLMLPSPQEMQYTRTHALNPSPLYHSAHDPSATANGGAGPPPGCTYPYTSDFHTPRHLAHLAPESALPGSTVGAVRPSSMHDLHGLASSPYGPPPSLYQNASAALYGAHAHASSSSSGGGGGGGLWDPSRAGPAQRSDHTRSNWPVLPALDITLARQRSYPSAACGPAHTALGAPNGKSEAYSPQLPARPWSSATSSTASSSSGGGGGGGGGPGSSSHYSHHGPHAHASSAFPTLSSAFFPAESPGAKAVDGASPASAHDYYSPLQPHQQQQQQGAGGVPGRRGSTGPGQAQDHSGYGSAQAQQQQQQQQQQHQYGGAAAQQSAAQAWAQHFSRTGGGGQQRSSGLHPISPYAMQGSPGGGGGGQHQHQHQVGEGGAGPRSASGSSSQAGGPPPLGFWDDTRFGGR